MTIRKKWFIGITITVVIFFTAVYVAGEVLLKRLDPMVREQAISYLQERFHADVQIQALHIHLPHLSKVGLVFQRQRGALVQVDAEGLSMRRSGTSEPPLFVINKLQFTVDVASILDARKKVDAVALDGLQITIPPKDERPASTGQGGGKKKPLNVEIDQVDIRNAKLIILPKDKTRNHLSFQIDHLLLTPIGPNSPMHYAADLNIPKPPGHVLSRGRFGPWNADEPGDTPLDGTYKFENADLGIFNGIAGILTSNGQFDGTLDTIHAKGEATVPDFRLKSAGNPVPLKTEFETIVDGTNGNTTLQPVHATLGQTQFTTTGAVVKHEEAEKRTISLQVIMPDGNLPDLLRLAMKGSPFMEGRINMKTRIDIPPLSVKVKKKIVLDGNFNLRQTKFLRSTIQSQIDAFSRRAQGQPKNQEIDSVASNMKGTFHLEDQVMRFRSLSFNMPGAAIAIAGNYNIGSQGLDFNGTMKLEAKVSEMVTGWKRWALKPIDPLFSKNGAGTFLNIVVEGDARHPEFGAEFAHHKFMVSKPSPSH